MNKQHISLLVFLDLSSAFDMIDHMVLLRRLEDKFVFCRTALEFLPVGQIPAGCNRRCNFWQVRHRLWCTAGFLHRSIIVFHLHGSIVRHCHSTLTHSALLCRRHGAVSGFSTTQDAAVAAMEACIQDQRR